MTVFYDDWRVVIPVAEPEPEPSRYVVDGLDYGLVFDSDYYLVNNWDVYNAYRNDWIAAFHHFLNSGMAEARVAKATFNVVIYRNRYPDLNSAFGDDWVQYYRHYIQHGAAEGREGV